jgi:hypothetical protein
MLYTQQVKGWDYSMLLQAINVSKSLLVRHGAGTPLMGQVSCSKLVGTWWVPLVD